MITLLSTFRLFDARKDDLSLILKRRKISKLKKSKLKYLTVFNIPKKVSGRPGLRLAACHRDRDSSQLAAAAVAAQPSSA
jgi:hypothetical protein